MKIVLCNRTLALVFVLTFTAQFAHNAHALTVGPVTIASPSDPSHAALYGKIELNIPLSTISTKFYEADPLQGGVDLSAVFTAPDASTRTIRGFYNGSAWLVRFAPTQTGVWQATVTATDSSGSASDASVTFTCVASASPGFAQINGKFIQFTNGSAFYAVGHNNGWQYLVEQPSSADMAAQGENLLSFWFAAPWAKPTDGSPVNARTPIENSVGGLGNYDQTASAYIDSVVSNAEAAGVYLLPSIWAHDQLCDGTAPSGWPASWSNNAYSTICTATNFYQTTSGGVDTQQWRLQKNYYRYILARWGYSRAIIGWVGVVEIDGTTGYALNSTQATNWCAAIRSYFSANDPFRINAGGAYPLIVSRVDAPTFDGGMNIRGTDSYTSKTSNVSVAATLASETATMRSSGKPGMIAEFGGDVLNGASQPAHMHNGIWAGTAAGTALAPLIWCDGGNYPMLTNTATGPAMRAQLNYLAQFVSGLDFTGDNALVAGAPAISNTSFKVWSLQMNNRGFAWIQNTTGSSVGGQTLTVHNLAPGQYSVAWYNVWNSGSIPFATTPAVTVSVSDLAVTVPTLAQADIACRFFLNPSAPGISAISASPNPVSGTNTALSVTAMDDGGESNLTYSWATVGTPPGPVMISANGTNAAKNAVVTFTSAGNYTFQVTVKDLGGLTTTASVVVTINATLTQSLSVAPASAVVPLNGSQQFTASVQDQFGHPMAQSLVWSVSGGGTIDSTGLFQASSAAGGPFTVTATTTETPVLTATASIGVVDIAPTVSITSPASGIVFSPGSPITIAANAVDDGSVANVAFYSNGTLLGTSTTAPYSVLWTGALAGVYSLTAVATDNAGQMTTSTAVTINVDAAPVVNMTAPANNAVFLKGSTVTVSANASDADGTISTVEFYAGATLIGTDTTAPYSISWTGAASGTYSVTSRATDNVGVVTVSAPITVKINAPPTCSVTSPANKASVSRGSTVTVKVSAADSDGLISSVIFYDNGATINTSTSSPYQYSYIPARGTHALTAKATDNNGATTTSATVTITVK